MLLIMKHPAEFIGKNFPNDTEFDELCALLQIEPSDIYGRTPRDRARTLQQYVTARGRLGDLLQAVQILRPNVDVAPYLYLFLEHYHDINGMDAEKMMNLLCQDLGVNCDSFWRTAAGNLETVPRRAQLLHKQMEEENRLEELFWAFDKRAKSVNLSAFRTYFSHKNDGETAVGLPLANRIEKPKANIQTYVDFDLRIGKAGDNGYPIVAESAYGETGQAIYQKLDVADYDFQDLITFLREGNGRIEDMEALGETLRTFLFPPPVWSLFGRSLAKVKAEGKTGLRIRLRIDAEAPELSRIPWEYCRDDRSYLGLNEATPLVRYIATERPPGTIQSPSPVKILLVIASPSDQASLDTDTEVARIKEALQPLIDANHVDLRILPHATKRSLRTSFRTFDPHVLHFIGHGEIKENGEGALVLQGLDGRSDRVDADDMLVLLQNSTVRLVVLNACKTADQTAGNAIMGVAPRLVWAGVPAVIAMQFNVPDVTAISFTHDLYEFLVAGTPLDTAVTEARIGLYFDAPEYAKPFWAIPVLFMRSPNGVLWTK